MPYYDDHTKRALDLCGHWKPEQLCSLISDHDLCCLTESVDTIDCIGKEGIDKIVRPCNWSWSSLFAFDIRAHFVCYRKSTTDKPVAETGQVLFIYQALDRRRYRVNAFLIHAFSHWKVLMFFFYYFSMKTYVVGTHSKCLTMSTHNIHFCGEIRKIFSWYPLLF